MSNHKKTWDFKEQLKVGTRAEELFMQYYHSPLVIIPDHYADFKRVSDGKIVELKGDQYDINKTENMFMERWSDVYKKKPGGCWQSRAKRVDVFCYMYVRNNVYFEFNDLKELCKRLDKLIANKNPIYIKNSGWITGGYKINRELLKDLYTVHTFTPEKTDRYEE